MAKLTMKFTAQHFRVGEHEGYRPQLEPQQPVADLDFCREVVAEKRLAMSPEELLHAIEMLGEVGPQKVALDGRPRQITKLLKFNRFATGKLESPKDPWNSSCKAVIRPQLMYDATRYIDASFVNVNKSERVTLDNVTWIGAESVQNVLKIGYDFAANGKNMQIVDGDAAWIEYGEQKIDLVCKTSDVSRAVFEYPEALKSVEPGTKVIFRLTSRAGDPESAPTPSKKEVTVLAGDPAPAYLAVSPDGLTKVQTLNGQSDLSELDPVSSQNGFTLEGKGLIRHVGQTPFLVWGDGDDEQVEIASIAEGAGGTITTTIGSAEVVLPVGTTTCHLTFGTGDQKVDIGPFLVTRAS